MIAIGKLVYFVFSLNQNLKLDKICTAIVQNLKI